MSDAQSSPTLRGPYDAETVRDAQSAKTVRGTQSPQIGVRIYSALTVRVAHIAHNAPAVREAQKHLEIHKLQKLLEMPIAHRLLEINRLLESAYSAQTVTDAHFYTKKH